MKIKLYVFIFLGSCYICYLLLKCKVLRKDFNNELESFMDCGEDPD